MGVVKGPIKAMVAKMERRSRGCKRPELLIRLTQVLLYLTSCIARADDDHGLKANCEFLCKCSRCRRLVRHCHDAREISHPKSKSSLLYNERLPS